jgi:hypothetical protein
MKTIDECACGIARADCDYHAPPAKPEKEPVRKYAFRWDGLWVPMQPWHAIEDGKYLTPDGYIHTYQDGKLINEEPATP